MGAHVPTVVVVPEVVVVVVLLGPVVVVVVATGVVVVLPIGIGSVGIGIVGIGIVGIGNWAICTRVSASGCAWPGRSPRTAKLASVAARRRTRAKRRRRSDLMMRTPSRWPLRHERDRQGAICRRKSAPQYPRGGKSTCERRATPRLAYLHGALPRGPWNAH